MSDQPTDWQPLKPLPKPPHFDLDFVKEVMEHYRLTMEETNDWLKRSHLGSKFFINDTYQVETAAWGFGLRITIQRRDGDSAKDWRHFQEVKNQLAGEEREAVELYPAESRKVDTSNKWHLWVLPEGSQFQLGWTNRDVRFVASDTPGLQQRAL